MSKFVKNIGQRRVLDLIKSPAKEILVASGSRSGKTFIFIYAIILIALRFKNSRHMIARKHFAHVKGSIWMDTLPKVIDLCFPELKPLIKFNNQDYFITFPNGSEIWLAGLDDKERVDKILGREYLTIFLNECSEISFETYSTVKSRLAQKCFDVNGIEAKNMMFLDENPTTSKHWSKILFVDKANPDSSTNEKVRNPERFAFTFIHPHENEANLSSDYIEMLSNLPPAQRKRFLDGVFADASAYALWDDDVIERNRVNDAPYLKRVVIAVDPAVTAKDTSDETGIIALGLDIRDEVFVLEDATGKYTPTEWANKTVELFRKHKADKVVGEVNQGGDMVETLLRTVAPTIPYLGVHATRDKFTRAEPVSALYYQNKVHHVGIFSNLELQQTQWEGKTGEKSPNNIDALVWGVAELLPELGVDKRMTGSFADAMMGRIRRK